MPFTEPSTASSEVSSAVSASVTVVVGPPDRLAVGSPAKAYQ
jgi:hypothetical protein